MLLLKIKNPGEPGFVFLFGQKKMAWTVEKKFEKVYPSKKKNKPPFNTRPLKGKNLL